MLRGNVELWGLVNNFDIEWSVGSLENFTDTLDVGNACVTCLRISDFCKSSISAFRGVTFQAEVSLACDLRVKQSTSH